jgi:hypothetical protein
LENLAVEDEGASPVGLKKTHVRDTAILLFPLPQGVTFSLIAGAVSVVPRRRDFFLTN